MLDEYRKKIDEIDKNIKDLFRQRLEIVVSVAEYKKANGLPIFNADREREVLQRRSDDAFDMQFFTALMDICKYYQVNRLMSKNIVLIGMMGCGKTTIGRDLAMVLNMPFVDMDIEIEESAGMTIPEIFDEYGEGHFRILETKMSRTIAEAKIPSIVATGGGVVGSPINMDALKKTGILFFLNRSIADILQDIDGADRPLFSNFNKLYKERLPLYEKYSDHTVIENPLQSIIEILLSQTQW